MITRDALTKIFLQQWGKSIDETNVKSYEFMWQHFKDIKEG